MALFPTTLGQTLGFDPTAVIATPTVDTSFASAIPATIDNYSASLVPTAISTTKSFDSSNIPTVSSTYDTAGLVAGVTAAPVALSDQYSATSLAPIINTTVASTSPANSSDIVVTATDFRIRLQPGINTSSYKSILGTNDPTNNILSILYDTQGLMFPYTPAISVSQSVGWDTISLVQTNWDVNAYQRTPSATISVNGIFTTQTQREGEYLMAVIHFLRVVSKSYFGSKDSAAKKAGTPPPVLYFNGYGDFLFNNLPVVVKSCNWAFDETTDTNLFTARNGATARLPAKMQISIELGIQINVNKQRDIFSLDDFRTGKLLAKGNGGGFF